MSTRSFPFSLKISREFLLILAFLKFFFFFLRFVFYVYEWSEMNIYVYCVCAWHPLEARRESPGTGVTGICKMLCGCWELNLCSESSFWAQIYFISCIWVFGFVYVCTSCEYMWYLRRPEEGIGFYGTGVCSCHVSTGS